MSLNKTAETILPTEAAPPLAAAPQQEPIDAPPPFLGSWRNVYLFVLGELALLVILFYVLTRWVS